MKRKLKPKQFVLLILISIIPLSVLMMPEYWMVLTPGGYDRALHYRLRGVDTVVVKPTMNFLGETRPRTFFTLQDADAQEFINAIHIKSQWQYCMCYGNPAFEFYREGELVLRLTNQHGGALRSDGTIWSGDAVLQHSSAQYLKKLLKRHGVPSD